MAVAQADAAPAALNDELTLVRASDEPSDADPATRRNAYQKKVLRGISGLVAQGEKRNDRRTEKQLATDLTDPDGFDG